MLTFENFYPSIGNGLFNFLEILEIRYLVTFYVEYSRAMTFENFCLDIGSGVLRFLILPSDAVVHKIQVLKPGLKLCLSNSRKCTENM